MLDMCLYPGCDRKERRLHLQEEKEFNLDLTEISKGEENKAFCSKSRFDDVHKFIFV